MFFLMGKMTVPVMNYSPQRGILNVSVFVFFFLPESAEMFRSLESFNGNILWQFFVAVARTAVILVPEQSCRDESRFQATPTCFMLMT